MSEATEMTNIPLWKLKETANTHRMVANALDSSKRETCLDRNVMRSWNHIVDIIREHPTSIEESISYYNTVGQVPEY